MADIKAIAFDVYGTLFDVHSVQEACDRHFPGKGEAIAAAWRNKQLEYAFLRQLMGQYEPFTNVTRDALQYTLEMHGCSYTDKLILELMDAYNRLLPYEETEEVLQYFQDRQLVVFSNGPDSMLKPLLGHAKLDAYFDMIISVDEIKQYKPATASYAYLLKRLDVKREELLFLSSNGWDIAGAKNFGFHTAWIDRKGTPAEKLGQAPDKVYEDLKDVKSEW
ncbi:haloacid dehalogenase type II [Terribacillus sp. 7520-G]|uniref:haloacid dehalogenase type II n=1 Tax=Terribacillus TaxID=459532 RepID=UPI000BA58BB9|nr:haloacid dehalogenase type II [Terribacillus sp. 7520-G]PAD37761.1 haloacid dehalogenase type II [Terribacillus sp. 7520-G]